MVQTTVAACLSWPGVLAWRLRRQYLVHRATRGEALGVVRQICGLHAQVMSSAELTLWARVEDLELDAIQEALWKERSLVKTWAIGVRFMCYRRPSCRRGSEPRAYSSPATTPQAGCATSA